MKTYKFVKTITDKAKTNILLIDWVHTVEGVVLELSYTGKGEERDVYKAFVNSVSQAVDDGCLPLELSRPSWYNFLSIQNRAVSRQYSIIKDDEGNLTLLWKSNFVEHFFA